MVSTNGFVNTTEPIMIDEEIISDVLDKENLEVEKGKNDNVGILIEPILLST